MLAGSLSGYLVGVAYRVCSDNGVDGGNWIATYNPSSVKATLGLFMALARGVSQNIIISGVYKAPYQSEAQSTHEVASGTPVRDVHTL